MHCTPRFVRLTVLLLSLCAACLNVPAYAASFSYTSIFVLGDSLVDLGNTQLLTKRQRFPIIFPPPQTYYQGRASNGPVAPEYLWQRLSGHAPGSAQALKPALALTRANPGQSIAFAFAGATTGAATHDPLGFTLPGLLGQVAMFKSFRVPAKAAQSSLYMIVVGSNDYLLAEWNGFVLPEQSVGNIARAIRQLHAVGARNFLVLNVPDLGDIPLVGPAPGLTYLAQEHNRLLAATLASLRKELAGVRITDFDLYAAAKSVYDEVNNPVPALEQLGEGAAACVFADPANCPIVADFSIGDGYFYWDLEHPTTQIHERLADLLFDALP